MTTTHTFLLLCSGVGGKCFSFITLGMRNGRENLAALGASIFDRQRGVVRESISRVSIRILLLLGPTKC